MTTTTRTTTADHSVACEDHSRTLQIVSPADNSMRAAWGQYVEAAPGATVFHHPDWLDAVAQTFGHRDCTLLALRGDVVAGVLPLMEVRSFLGGRLLVSVPYGNSGGILAQDEATCAGLAESAAALAVRCGARVLELRSERACAPGFDAVTGYLGFVRELPLHPNEMETFLPRKARAAARQARDRAGLVMRHDAALAHTVWELYCRNMRRLGSINYPWAFFEHLFRRRGERAWATVGWLNDQPVAGTISLVFGDTVMPYIVGTDERIRCDGAANLLYWSVAERAVRSGLRRFDFGRSRADNHGSASFKKNQGFEPHPLEYQRFVPPGQQPPNLKPSNPRFALARRIWPKLPLPLTRALGAWLARSIPG